MRAKELIPTIGVADLDEAIAFYTKMGFKKEWKWPENQPTHAEVSIDGIKVMMVRKEEDNIQKADLYIIVEGVIDFHKKISGRLNHISGLEKTDYGMLDFSLDDPWGNFITFGESSEGYE